MNILHVSDLHITDDHPDETLDTLWGAVYDAVRGTRFHFIVVSGDLSQRSEWNEYQQLLSFTEEELIPLLISEERRRIIFVPGNHDVMWRPTIWEAADPSQLPENKEELQKLHKRYLEIRRRPTREMHRFDLKQGFLQLRKINERKYQRRFANAQRFLEKFYKNIPEGDRNFNLTAPRNKGEDWSLHVFSNECVAFFGFNSCFCNDEYWTGAHINPKATKNAGRIARRLGDELRLIAVWHHGLSSEQGDPGYLGLTDLDRIYGVGCKIGFHGHTHKDSVTLANAHPAGITTVSTGSLGAGTKDRPEGVANKFSIVRLLTNGMEVKVYSRSDNRERFQGERPRLVSLPGWGHFGATHVKTHKRTWEVGEDAIVRTTVEFEGLTSELDVPLAIAQKPYNQCKPASNRCQVDQERIEVKSRDQLDGALRYVMPPQNADSVTWHLDTSNALAVYAEDLKILEERETLHPHIQKFEDAVAHTVKFDTGYLELSLRFLEPPARGLPQPRMFKAPYHLVEKRVSDNWRTMNDERGVTLICDETSANPTWAQLKVDRPKTGYRYSIVYEPASNMATTSREMGDNVASELIDMLRDEPAVRDLIDKLTTHLAAVTELFLDGTLDVDKSTNIEDAADKIRERLKPGCDAPLRFNGSWYGLLWQAYQKNKSKKNKSNQRKLLPVFGEFPMASWADSFRAGVGLAGHAFRINNPVAWIKGKGTSLIYSPDSSAIPYEWLLCFPIWVARGGPSVGVISFGGQNSQETEIGKKLRELTVLLSVSEPASTATYKRMMLHYWLTISFWRGAAMLFEHQGMQDIAEQANKFAKSIAMGTIHESGS